MNLWVSDNPGYLDIFHDPLEDKAAGSGCFAPARCKLLLEGWFGRNVNFVSSEQLSEVGKLRLMRRSYVGCRLIASTEGWFSLY